MRSIQLRTLAYGSIVDDGELASDSDSELTLLLAPLTCQLRLAPYNV
jgi:hypothetical protein